MGALATTRSNQKTFTKAFDKGTLDNRKVGAVKKTNAITFHLDKGMI